MASPYSTFVTKQYSFMNSDDFPPAKLNLDDVPRDIPLIRKDPGKLGTSLYKGVHWRARGSKWDSKIKLNGKQYSLGQFDTEEEAALEFARATWKYRTSKEGYVSTKCEESPKAELRENLANGPRENPRSVKETSIEQVKSYKLPKKTKSIDVKDVPNNIPLIYKKAGEAGVSLYKGVSRRGRAKWQSSFYLNKKSYYLGEFEHEEEAALVYAKAVWKYRCNKEEGNVAPQSKIPCIPKFDLKDIPEGIALFRKQGTGKYVGVSPSGDRKWSAAINLQGEKHHLGTFNKAKDAARVYAMATYKLSHRANGASEVTRETALGNTYSTGDENGKMVSQWSKGVRWKRGAKKWQARIHRNGREIYLGSFATEQQAVHAYSEAVRKYIPAKKGAKSSRGSVTEANAVMNQLGEVRDQSGHDSTDGTAIGGSVVGLSEGKRKATAAASGQSAAKRKKPPHSESLLGHPPDNPSDSTKLPDQGQSPEKGDRFVNVNSTISAKSEDEDEVVVIGGEERKIMYLEDYTAEDVAWLIESKGEKFQELARSLKEADFQGAFVADLLSQGEDGFHRFLEEDTGVSQRLLRISVLKSLQRVPCRGSAAQP